MRVRALRTAILGLLLVSSLSLLACAGEQADEEILQRRNEILVECRRTDSVDSHAEVEAARAAHTYFAFELEELAARTENESLATSLLHDAAMTHLYAALILQPQVHDATRRLHPSAEWDDYVDAAERRDALAAGATETRATSPLAPLDMFLAWEDKGRYVGWLYGDEYVGPSLHMFEESRELLSRCRAGVTVVRLGIMSEWGLCCYVSQAVHSMEKAADVQTTREARMLCHAVDQMWEMFHRALLDRKRDLKLAMTLHLEATGSYPSEEVLNDTSLLFTALAPFLADAVNGGNSRLRERSKRVGEWMDLEANPFETIPGLRYDGVVWTTTDGGTPKPLMQMTPTYWEGHVGASDRPWTRRLKDRLDRLGE